MRANRKRTRREVVRPLLRRRRHAAEEDEIDAEQLAIGPGDKPGQQAGQEGD
jgi:hypothetical protein